MVPQPRMKHDKTVQIDGKGITKRSQNMLRKQRNHFINRYINPHHAKQTIANLLKKIKLNKIKKLKTNLIFQFTINRQSNSSHHPKPTNIPIKIMPLIQIRPQRVRKRPTEHPNIVLDFDPHRAECSNRAEIASSGTRHFLEHDRRNWMRSTSKCKYFYMVRAGLIAVLSNQLFGPVCSPVAEEHDRFVAI